ncbi:MAG: hypothetical protein MJZ32_09700 [Bacteroidaceae bacterium]|nr:hypothetical protein [Bacteroidaceae bacterium]
MNKSRNVLIIGEHPIKDSIKKQFCQQRCEVTEVLKPTESELRGLWHEIVVLSSADNDADAIKTVETLAEAISGASQLRPTVHLLLQRQETLRLLNTRDHNDEWHRCFELNAFTIEDLWAKNMLCLNQIDSRFPGLDYKPITLESNRVVHLVVFGLSYLTTSLAEHAALVAHYPNYTRNHSLRTRITIIDSDMSEWSRKFVSMHKPLMDNSYYRYIDTKKQQCDLHKPMYEGQREDYVDVEWEFAGGSIHDIVVQDKLQGWADDENQVLSIALCHDDDSRNLAEATLIADMLCNQEIPVYVKQSTSVMQNIISQSPRMRNVIMIGMEDSGYDINLPLLRMAKRVNSVYEYCYNNNIASQTEGCITAPSYIDDKEADAYWLNVRKAIKRYSNICNAMTLATKMRSLGHSAEETGTFYAITKQEIDIIAEVEHNRWSVEELLLGFRPCTDEEQADIETDISKKKAEYKNRLVHYDLRAYNDLRADDTGKNVNTYDICISASIPLIAYKTL